MCIYIYTCIVCISISYIYIICILYVNISPPHFLDTPIAQVRPLISPRSERNPGIAAAHLAKNEEETGKPGNRMNVEQLNIKNGPTQKSLFWETLWYNHDVSQNWGREALFGRHVKAWAS